ncbi:hypothetical protein K2O51_31135 (plasmid) [Cupriavidus pinatubonensis]|uniref:hypothetical protein n=1 Tax=Cupriavidus pinatubonensis TaxID=248026 RepID=UPI001C73ADDD|nr:hypothetical protein [Cupriavidus pinatubonensis]QYY33701.1 hypothetical protein K2O51_31135 [Cupriavidus pinatubonensis]
MRSQVASISLTRIEGAPVAGINERVTTWAQADSVLRRWSESVARDGGYDKCEFSVEWQNGATYHGRYDLVNWRDATPDLARHIRELAYFYTGRRTPAHMTLSIYGAFLDMHCTKAVATQYEKLLARNDLGVAEHPTVQVQAEAPAAAGAFQFAGFARPAMSGGL